MLLALARCAEQCDTNGLYAEADAVTGVMERLSDVKMLLNDDYRDEYQLPPEQSLKREDIPCENQYTVKNHPMNLPTHYYEHLGGRYLCRRCAEDIVRPPEPWRAHGRTI